MQIEQLLIEEDSTVLEAMRKLDEVAKKVLFIVEDNKLKASLTDGDIRRWILSNGDLQAKIRLVANYNPKYITEAKRAGAVEYMRKYSIEALPVINDNKQIVNIVMWDNQELIKANQIEDVPVVIMAGGLGTRLYPYTKILPKPLIPIGDIPIAEHIIAQFKKYGCRQFYLVVNHKKNMIKAYFNEIEKDYEVFYAEETIPLGTGGGISLLKGKITDTFILSNCDILIKEDIGKIYKMHKKKKNKITVVCSLKNFKIPYGVVQIKENGEIGEMKEKPSLSFFTNTGCYIVEPEVIDEMEKDEAIGFPDIIERYKNKGDKVGVYPISEASWLDMGQLDELQKMQKSLEL